MLCPMIATAAVVVSLASVPAVASAAVIDCDNYVGDEINVRINSARNLSCSAAELDMGRHRGSIDRRFRTPGGFLCVRVSGSNYGGQWRCVRGARAYRFESRTDSSRPRAEDVPVAVEPGGGGPVIS